MRTVISTAMTLLVLCGAAAAQDVDRRIDQFETKFLELISEYNTHERTINNSSLFYVPVMGGEPRPMSRDDLIGYLMKMKIYMNVNVGTITQEALQFNKAYKDQMRYEYMPMILTELNRDLNDFSNYLANKRTPLTKGDHKLLLRMNMVLDDFRRKDAIRDNPFIKPTLDRALRGLDSLGGGGGGTQPNVDTRHIDKLLGNWQLFQEGKPTTVIKFYLDGQKGSYCGRIMTSSGIKHYSQGEVIVQDIYFEKFEEVDWEVERDHEYRFKGTLKYNFQGQWREGEVLLVVTCVVYDDSGTPEGCSKLGWHSPVHDFMFSR